MINKVSVYLYPKNFDPYPNPKRCWLYQLLSPSVMLRSLSSHQVSEKAFRHSSQSIPSSLSRPARSVDTWFLSFYHLVRQTFPSIQGYLEDIKVYGYGSIPMKIPFLGEWPSIYQLFWCSPGVQGFDTLPYKSEWTCFQLSKTNPVPLVVLRSASGAVKHDAAALSNCTASCNSISKSGSSASVPQILKEEDPRAWGNSLWW